MDNVFKLTAKNLYNLRQLSEFSRPFFKTVYYGTKTILETKNIGHTARKDYGNDYGMSFRPLQFFYMY